MKSIINKIFHNEKGEEMHNEFVKYSRGLFWNKYMLAGKKQKDRWTIKAGPEFANFLVRRCLEESSGEVEVKGIVVSTVDLRGKLGLEISGVKQFMGIKQHIISGKFKPGDIIGAMNGFPKGFYALSFITGDSELKIKAKAPKSAKPAATGEKEAVPDFCSIKTTDRSIVEDLFFDHPNFIEIKANHTIEIKDIIINKNEPDPVKMRESAIRKGKIKRVLTVDGKELVSEADFEA